MSKINTLDLMYNLFLDNGTKITRQGWSLIPYEIR